MLVCGSINYNAGYQKNQAHYRAGFLFFSEMKTSFTITVFSFIQPLFAQPYPIHKWIHDLKLISC